METIILSIGDELISGDITNTNSSFIASQLSQNGIDVTQIISIGDNYVGIMAFLSSIPKNIDKVFISGGLGPTHDDITKRIATDFFETKLIFNEDVYNNIKQRFIQLGREVTEANRSQAYLPGNCILIKNNFGTASGMKFSKNGVDFYFMPGVPYEMKAMLIHEIIPTIISDTKIQKKIKIIRTYGTPESNLYDSMKTWINENSEIKVGFYPKQSGIDIKLQYYNNYQKPIDDLIWKLGNIIYGFDNETIEEKIGEILIEKNMTIAVAESCTGGLISSRITDISGSSKYLKYGIVTYSNEAKIKILGVNKQTLEQYGAVSREVAIEMAVGVRKIDNCDIGISITGIAGPTGGTEAKPLGTMWCAINIGKKTEAFHFCWNINRKSNKILFSQFVFKKLLDKVRFGL